MINLIMKVSDDDWNVPVGQIASSTMPLSRYLEYTSDRLSVMYREVNQNVLNNLKLIPCLLMTEFVNEQHLDGRSRMFSNVRVAMLESVAVKGKNLDYTLRINYDFGRVVVDNFRALGDRLFFHLFETSRTHWAIKDVSLPDVLAAFELKVPAPSASATGEAPPPATPSGSNEPAQCVKSVEAFLQKIREVQAPEGHEMFYRGHSDYRYKLEPSLFREEEAVPLYKHKERKMINEILTAHPAEFLSGSVYDR